ncbi:MAG: prepilin-type N-terminal cleavage/methylation domain-containing protein, partial [Mariniblastus sp.]
MITPRHHRPRSGASRSGFTLVELLVAITVIGILVGMLLTAVIPVLTRAKETKILMEMKQIEQSIENFKNQNGFYPPSWVNIRLDRAGNLNDPLECADELLRYINGFAKNNREGVGVRGSRPIDAWWTSVGSKIDHRRGQDLVFWLSGLCKNKQFPLSNGNGFAFNGDNVERDVFYEFKDQQLVKVEYPADMASVAGYDQQASSDAPFLYIDNDSYNIPGTTFD